MKGIVIGISVAAIIAVTIVIVIFVVVPIVKPIVAPPQVQLTSHSATYVGGIFDQQILISGRVANSGMSASNPVSLGITITDPNGNILYL